MNNQGDILLSENFFPTLFLKIDSTKKLIGKPVNKEKLNSLYSDIGYAFQKPIVVSFEAFLKYLCLFSDKSLSQPNVPGRLLFSLINEDSEIKESDVIEVLRLYKYRVSTIQSVFQKVFEKFEKGEILQDCSFIIEPKFTLSNKGTILSLNGVSEGIERNREHLASILNSLEIPSFK